MRLACSPEGERRVCRDDAQSPHHGHTSEGETSFEAHELACAGWGVPYLPITTLRSGRLCAVKLPTNHYDDATAERDALLAIFEQLRGIRVAVWALVVLVAVLLVVVWVN